MSHQNRYKPQAGAGSWGPPAALDAGFREGPGIPEAKKCWGQLKVVAINQPIQKHIISWSIGKAVLRKSVKGQWCLASFSWAGLFSNEQEEASEVV